MYGLKTFRRVSSWVNTVGIFTFSYNSWVLEWRHSGTTDRRWRPAAQIVILVIIAVIIFAIQSDGTWPSAHPQLWGCASSLKSQKRVQTPFLFHFACSPYLQRNFKKRNSCLVTMATVLIKLANQSHMSACDCVCVCVCVRLSAEASHLHPSLFTCLWRV